MNDYALKYVKHRIVEGRMIGASDNCFHGEVTVIICGSDLQSAIEIAKINFPELKDWTLEKVETKSSYLGKFGE